MYSSGLSSVICLVSWRDKECIMGFTVVLARQGEVTLLFQRCFNQVMVK